MSGSGHALHAFALEPTTGVFVVDGDAYKRQRDVIVGGLDWTVMRGSWIENTELDAFLLAYFDGRGPDDVAGLFGDIEVYTLGGSWLGVYPIGPGRADVLLWGAFQWGDYEDVGRTSGPRRRDQLAGAMIGELGYQLPDVWSQPWLRVGVNWASGDGDLDDGDRHTFFNVLPTNHLYYGSLDQLAFANLIDLLAQLKLVPCERLGLEITYHRFWLQEADDFRWAGTGAFSRRSLGYVRNASNGSRDVGHELDVGASYRLYRSVVLSFGFSQLWGGRVLPGNAHFAYTQLSVSY